jgi:hypothetical protein
MKTLLLFLLAVFLLAFTVRAGSSDPRSGVWTAELKDNQLELSIFHGSRDGQRGVNVMGFKVALADLDLAKSAVESSAANVTFALKREAGTVAFDGRFATGDGAGQYKFAPNDAYQRELNALGFDDIGDNEMLVFAAHDLRLATIRELIAIGQKPQRRQLDEIAVFHITPALLREYATLGFPSLTIREAVQMRVGSIDANFVHSLRELGYANLSAREISEMGILGATPAYIRSLRDAGLRDLSPRDATQLRVGQVTPQRIEELRRAGYTNLSARQLSELGIHGITPAYIEELRKLGYDNLTPRQLIEMKVNDVTPEYIRSMRPSS